MFGLSHSIDLDCVFPSFLRKIMHTLPIKMVSTSRHQWLPVVEQSVRMVATCSSQLVYGIFSGGLRSHVTHRNLFVEWTACLSSSKRIHQVSTIWPKFEGSADWVRIGATNGGGGRIWLYRGAFGAWGMSFVVVARGTSKRCAV